MPSSFIPLHVHQQLELPDSWRDFLRNWWWDELPKRSSPRRRRSGGGGPSTLKRGRGEEDDPWTESWRYIRDAAGNSEKIYKRRRSLEGSDVKLAQDSDLKQISRRRDISSSHSRAGRPQRHAQALTIINGGTFFSGPGTSEGGLHILHHAAVLEAYHNSTDGFTRRACHPGTREELLNDLWRWETGQRVLKSEPWWSCVHETQFLWLHGPAGTGKSAIAHTFAERLDRAGRLGGSFFFKRGHLTRGNAKALFLTIAYQLAFSIPGLKVPVLQAVEDDPSVVGRSMESQLRQLILEPCQALDKDSSPWIVVVDGLDECAGQDVQQEVLRLLGTNCCRGTPPLRFLIASRPEPHISESFANARFRKVCRSLQVGQSFEDVRTYLDTEFNRIHREHHQTMAWPSSEVLGSLVQKSSGHFLYPSTVVKFIDDKRFRPPERLAMIGNVARSEEESPFVDIDLLYTQILSGIPDRRRLRAILSAVLAFKLSPRHIEQLLELQPGDVRLALRDLHSVLHIPSDSESAAVTASPVSVRHASFRDFLGDSMRSAEFYLGPQHGLDLARSVLKALCHRNGTGDVYDNLARVDHVAWCVRITCILHYALFP
ncbi:hypothetical protein DFH06DRAFT_284632 [Mycena polygramma]|nr:hypothetical protein DFH06DRAFT_284632 [Mycena polygramma]